MKKLFFIIALISTAFVQTGLGQDSAHQTSLSSLLPQYFAVKDALVSGNGTMASTKAGEFLETLNSINNKVISEGNINALRKDVTSISNTRDVKKQREYFSNFSNNMIALAKTLKLSNEPVYQAFCPMKKANWLSSDQTIKNPYFGSSMLNCGKVVETYN